MDNDLASIDAARRAVERAAKAQMRFSGFEITQIDRVVEYMARAVEPEAERLAELAVAETGHGNVADKRIKNLFNARAIADHLRDVTALGVLWRDDRTRLVAVGEPAGIIAALVPVTNPTSTIIFKALSAIKAGNAVVFAPHPRALRSGVETVRVLEQAARSQGAPPGLIQCLDPISIEGTSALMQHRQTAMVLATGGTGMVRAAYRSGKPTLAVGPGNVPVFVHRSKSQNLGEVAEQIITSKSFDYGTACVSEQAIIADTAIARELQVELRLHGARFVTTAEASRLAEVLFAGQRVLQPAAVGQSASRLARLADFDVPPGTRCLVSEEQGVGWQQPLSAEKLSPVLAFYKVPDLAQGKELARRILDFGGLGHSAVIHAEDPEAIAEFSALPVGRLLVNTPALTGGMGFSTDLEPSFMLGTGTWSGSMTSDNVTALHLINIRRVAYENRPWRDIYAEYGK